MVSPDPTGARNREENMVPPNTKPTETRDRRGSTPAESTGGMDAEAPTCRICYRGTASAGEEHGPLVSPCSCRGLIGFAHKRCLETWLREKETNLCDVCLQRFSVRLKPVEIPCPALPGEAVEPSEVHRSARVGWHEH
ncbi:E3 ubiquitin-protein ligase MARCHF8 [Dermacentor silvarum]|uniref:E3 ubiquitin-protein ligase MARCHF8 n=1 Tax=Dermacentor silvarum TaxID=543639 RepID=UPI00189B82EA|nr:E3 ubiquitin-protein ligase MARCHF8 [Dermacentor silvarum]